MSLSDQTLHRTPRRPDPLGGTGLGDGVKAVETERSIALLEDAKAGKRAGVSGKVKLFVVLRDNDAAGHKERSRSKNSQHAFVLFSRCIGRIDENKIERPVVRRVHSGELFKSAQGVGPKHGCTGAHVERFQVFANQRDGRRMFFDEDDFRSAAAERLDAYRTCPRKNINESRACDCRTEHIEKSLPQTVAGGTQCEVFGAFQDAAAIGSGNDAHGIAILQTQDGELNSPLQKRARPAATNQATTRWRAKLAATKADPARGDKPGNRLNCSTNPREMVTPLPFRRQSALHFFERRRTSRIVRKRKRFAPRSLQQLAVAQRAGHVEAEVP
jgi:hypothetical protein